jgi:hypothetical protein
MCEGAGVADLVDVGCRAMEDTGETARATAPFSFLAPAGVQGDVGVDA